MVEFLSEDQLAELKEAFSLFDQDGNGSISVHELATVMRVLGQNPSEAELQDMLNEIDIDGNGNIEFPEFVAMMARKFKDINVEEELVEAFKVLDYESDGTISLDDLRRALSKYSDKMTTSEINEIMTEAKLDVNGHFNYEDFVKAMMNN